MRSLFPAPQLQRDDRYVQRCRVIGAGRQSATRLQFSIEEALRLSSLPGESEGRVYYFRKVIVKGVAPLPTRQQWTSAVEAALKEVSSRALHGSDPRAATANAVFFSSHHEALEVLLSKTLRGDDVSSWYWTQVSSAIAQGNRAEVVQALIKRIQELPASWVAVADSVFAALASNDPIALLDLLPPATAHSWLQEIGSHARDDSRPVSLRRGVAEILLHSAQTLAGTDPRVVWLASLAVLQAAPSELSVGGAVSRALATLQNLIRESLRDFHPEAGEQRRSEARVIQFQDAPLNARVDDAQKQTTADHSSALAERDTGRREKPLREISADTESTEAALAGPTEASEVRSRLKQPRTIADVSLAEAKAASSSQGLPRISGEPTQAAGLYFLLNALGRLHIAEALVSSRAATEQGLVARILKRLASHAGVEATDPAWQWITSALAQLEPSSAPFPANIELFPTNLRAPDSMMIDVNTLSRLWCVAIRRWCWRSGGLTVQEIVNRQGRISLNRTDLDVTLPLTSADLRIRRVGLDVDPGWLPWFGKVVRFHYVWDGGTNVH